MKNFKFPTTWLWYPVLAFALSRILVFGIGLMTDLMLDRKSVV